GRLPGCRSGSDGNDQGGDGSEPADRDQGAAEIRHDRMPLLSRAMAASLHEGRVGAPQLDAADVGLADEKRDVLADGAAPDMVRQIRGDGVFDGVEGKLAPLDAVVEPGDVEAEPGLDRHRADLADLQIEQEGFELRHRRAAGDLPEVAALLARAAVRK